jgi:hypothetical protein
MGCCYCCLDEAAKVKLIMQNFAATGVSQLMDGALQLGVGFVELAGNQPFYSPGGEKFCVYYKIRVDEEWRRTRRVQDQNGNSRTEVYYEWETIYSGEKYTDFYLRDGQQKMFVQGSNRGQCKVASDDSASGGNSWNSFGMNNMPMGIRMLIMQNATQNFGWGRNGTTGKYRFQESSFDVGEKVAALGVVTPSTDPYTGQPIKFCMPFKSDSITEAYMLEQKWHKHAIEAWKEFTAPGPQCLLSDSKKTTMAVNIAPWTPPPPIPVNWGAQFGAAVPQGQPQMQGQPMQGQPMQQQPMQQQQMTPQQGQPMQQQQMMPQQGQPMQQQPMPGQPMQ